MIRRIFIVGSPGSGKTTLASKLSKDLTIPHFDLDNIRYPKRNVKRKDAESIALLGNLVKKDAWIIEGVYVSWIKNYLNQADMVIWLDTPFHLSFYRVVKRYLSNIITNKSRHGLRSTLVLTKNIIRYHFPKPGTEFNDESEYVTRHKTGQVLLKFEGKTKRIKNSQDLKIFTENIVRGHTEN